MTGSSAAHALRGRMAVSLEVDPVKRVQAVIAEDPDLVAKAVLELLHVPPGVPSQIEKVTTPSATVLRSRVGDRVVVTGLHGRRIAWLDADGRTKTTTLTVDNVEIPRCDSIDGYRRFRWSPRDDVTSLAKQAAETKNMEIHTMVEWDGGILSLQDGERYVGPSIGFLLVSPASGGAGPTS